VWATISPVVVSHHPPKELLECSARILGNGEEEELVRFDHQWIVVPPGALKYVVGPVNSGLIFSALNAVIIAIVVAWNLNLGGWYRFNSVSDFGSDFGSDFVSDFGSDFGSDFVSDFFGFKITEPGFDGGGNSFVFDFQKFGNGDE
jgi:hypothetical protein